MQMSGGEKDPNVQQAVEAAVFRRLAQHLRDNADVQNIELMVLADFCRNCLAKWYAAAAAEHGAEMDYEAAREVVYGMPYADYKRAHQTPATPEQLAAMAAKQASKQAAGAVQAGGGGDDAR